MLDFPLTPSTETATVFTQVSCLFDALCTEFNHDASQETFAGTARLYGFIRRVTYSLANPIGTSTELLNGGLGYIPVTVATGSWDTVAGTGSALLTGAFTPVPFFGVLAEALEVTFDTDFTPDGTGATGFIGGTLAFFPVADVDLSSVVRASSQPFSLTFNGAGCPL